MQPPKAGARICATKCHDHRGDPRANVADQTRILRIRLEITLEMLMIMQEELEALHEKVCTKTAEFRRCESPEQRVRNRQPSEMPAHQGAAYWRARAQEARVLAEHMSDEKSRSRMLQVALDYDKLADWAATHNGDDPVLTSLSS
jgi:hypothetical protein